MVRRKEKQVLLILLTLAMFDFDRGFSPNCSFSIDSAQWSLNGVCTVVTKHEEGWCKWQQKSKKNDKQTEWETEPFETVKFTGTKSSSSNLYTWNCLKTFQLDVANILYTYEVSFPEPYTSEWFEAFFVKLVDPGQPILKNCPLLNKEKKIVTCECSSQLDGQPRPVFSWPGWTNSSILQLNDIGHDLNITYTCQMSWGKQTKTILYTRTVWNEDGRNSQTTSSSLVQIIGVVGAVVFIIAIVTIVTVVIIRRTRRIDRQKSITSGTVSMGTLPNSGNHDCELINNSYYVGFQFDTSVDLKMEGKEYVDVTTSTKHDEEPIQPDLYAAVETKEMSQTTHGELYVVVEKNKDSKQTKLYASVAKPSQKQQAKADNATYCSKKDDFISEGDVYAVVDKKIKP